MGKVRTYIDLSTAAGTRAPIPLQSVHVKVRDPQILHAVLEGLSSVGLRAIIGDPDGNGTGNCALYIVELPHRGLAPDALARPHSGAVLAVMKAREADGLDPAALKGADDLILSPWHQREFLWRVERLLGIASRKQAAEMSLGPITVQAHQCTVLVEGRPVRLTKTQFNLLKYLLANADRVVSRAELMEHLWGSRHGASASLIGTHVHSLRRRLGAAGRLIVTVRGFGYTLSRGGRD